MAKGLEAMTATGTPPPESRDLAESAVRALVLYSLAEFQSGHATTIRVSAQGSSFSVTDDGRGHAIERVIGNASYLKFVYTHLDYPFEPDSDAPVQLQGIGMSLINALCSELSVTVRKPSATLRLSFRDGEFDGSERLDVQSNETGNTIAGTISPHLHKSAVDMDGIEQWLRAVQAASRSLKILFNGRELGEGHLR